MIISLPNCWDSARSEHNTYFDKVTKKRLKRLKSKLTIGIVKFLSDNHDKIRDCDEGIARTLQAEYDQLKATYALSTQTRIDGIIKKIYNYDAFSAKKSDGSWSAYSLCARLGTTTCPYCNLAYGHTLMVGSDGKIRPELDHFFDKATYPLFAISLGNFVPSCHYCNSSLKLSSNFYTKHHLNPLVDTECIEINLNVDPLVARNDLRLIETANIEIRYDRNNTKAKNSAATFHLESRYQLLVDEARQIAKYLAEYRTQQGIIPGSVQWALRGVDSTNYKNRVLGKMIMDLASTYL